MVFLMGLFEKEFRRAVGISRLLVSFGKLSSLNDELVLCMLLMFSQIDMNVDTLTKNTSVCKPKGAFN